MAKSVPIRLKSKKTVHYKAVFAQLLAEMDCLDAQTDKDRTESERLRAETQIIKAETEIIKARTNATLARLQEQINNLARAA